MSKNCLKNFKNKNLSDKPDIIKYYNTDLRKEIKYFAICINLTSLKITFDQKLIKKNKIHIKKRAFKKEEDIRIICSSIKRLVNLRNLELKIRSGRLYM